MEEGRQIREIVLSSKSKVLKHTFAPVSPEVKQAFRDPDPTEYVPAEISAFPTGSVPTNIFYEHLQESVLRLLPSSYKESQHKGLKSSVHQGAAKVGKSFAGILRTHHQLDPGQLFKSRPQNSTYSPRAKAAVSKWTTPTYLDAPACKAPAPPARPPAPPPPPLAGPGGCRALRCEPPPSPQRPRPRSSARFRAVPSPTRGAHPPAAAATAGATARQAAVAAAGAEGALRAPPPLGLGLLLPREHWRDGGRGHRLGERGGEPGGAANGVPRLTLLAPPPTSRASVPRRRRRRRRSLLEPGLSGSAPVRPRGPGIYKCQDITLCSTWWRQVRTRRSALGSQPLMISDKHDNLLRALNALSFPFTVIKPNATSRHRLRMCCSIQVREKQKQTRHHSFQLEAKGLVKRKKYKEPQSCPLLHQRGTKSWILGLREIQRYTVRVENSLI
ncbi:uncharacterized protein LOC132654157 [Meriones unguiculatus]|uniref:uncharacterized protein LOC132654157 n=1 Tax=Meriones unguiculatus TaxID=10047 RepID=UPI00293F361A|nr:uncharacterized protein LOC132654157 [Meriones unguiculatus]